MDSNFSISLTSVSKRYDHQWIFRNLSYDFYFGQTYAIRGYNGSGKSTLLRMLSSMESPSTGQRSYSLNHKALAEDKVYNYLSYAAPYIKMPGYFTLKELINFHSQFKTMTWKTEDLLLDLELEKSANKEFEKLSSGQQQKVKLALAIHNTDLFLLLDEPGTNLDESNYAWFKSKLELVKDSKLICIATNEKRDLELADQQLKLDQLALKGNAKV